MVLKRNFLLILLTIISIFLFLGNTNAASEPQYKLYTDSANVRWQYAYINQNGNEYVEVSFFDAPAGITSVTVPSITTLRNNDSSEITASVNKLYLVNYTSHLLSGSYSGQTPNTNARNITQINLSNVTNVNGVSPMLNKNVKTTIIFAQTASEIGDAIKSEHPSAGENEHGVGVFEGANLTLQNLNHVTSIGIRAFAQTTLTETNLDLTANLKIIKDGAFWGSNVTTLKINTPKIDYNAFRDCANLTKVTLGSSVTEIAAAAFRNCPVLTYINFYNVTKVGNFAFSDCTALNVDISDTSFNSIGDAAFNNTTSLKYAITIPKGVTSIGWRTFYNSGITELKLNNVTTVATEAFAECQNLSKIDFGRTKVIKYRAFYNLPKVKNIAFSDSVIDVQTQAFMNDNIATLDLNKVKKLEHQAFANNNLTEIYLPKSLIYVYRAAEIFNNNHITKVTVAYDTSLNTIETPFFTLLGSNYTTLTDLIIEAPYGENDALVNELVEGTTMRSSHQYIPSRGYSSASDDTNPAYGNANAYKNVIQCNYFSNLPALENITIGDGYEFIGAQAFMTYDMLGGIGKPRTSIKKVDLPSTLKGIGALAFYYVLGNVEDKVDITLPANLEYIGAQAFFYDYGFKENLDLENLKYIGPNAFAESGIGDIYLHDSIKRIDTYSFFQKDTFSYYGNSIGHDHTKKLIIDFDIYSYVSPSFWSYLNNGQTYDLIKFTSKAVTQPVTNAYMYKVKAKEIDLSETPWTNMGDGTFIQSQIDTLKLPPNLKSIGVGAFYQAQIKNVVDIPDTVETIKDGAFVNANVKIDQLPSSLKEIASGSFYNCDFNSDPVFPAGAKIVGHYATFGSDPGKGIKRNSFTFLNNFENFTGVAIAGLLSNTEVKTLHFGKEVTHLPSYYNTSYSEFYNMSVEEAIFDGLEVLPQNAFLDCKNLTTVDFSQDENLKEIKQQAFYRAEKLNKIKFANKNADITLGYSAVRDTGLTSIGGPDSGFDLTSNHFITDAYVFSENAQLENVEIPNNFNNHEIAYFSFWNCKNLKSVSIGNKIETIIPFAFCGDEKLEKIFLWGDTNVIAGLSSYSPITERIPIIISNYSTKENLEFNLLVDGQKVLTLKPKDFTENDQKVKTYTYMPQSNGKLTFEDPKNSTYVTVSKNQQNNCYNVSILDINPANFTIPANTDIYTYSSYEVKNWDKTYEDMRRNKELGTNSTVYFLDEVLHLTSNHPKVNFNEDETDFDKSNLIVYALRRDGIVMESDKWGEYTKHYLRNKDLNFETYDADTTETEQIIYDYPFDPAEADVSTENFANMQYQIRTTNDFIQKKEIDLIYTNDFLEDSTVKTDIEPAMSIIDIVETGDNFIKLLTIFIIATIGIILGARKLKELK